MTAPAPASDFNPTTPVRPFTVPAGDPRIPWALTGAVVVFMLGVLAIAWRATSNLGSSGVPIGETAGEGSAVGKLGDGNASQQQLLILEEILRQQKLATQAALGAVVMDGPPRMPPRHHITLAIAQESIDEKRFAEARSSLYGMLATSDRLSGEDRSQAEEAATYLLAQSYRLESAAEPGEER